MFLGLKCTVYAARLVARENQKRMKKHRRLGQASFPDNFASAAMDAMSWSF
jgi:hypothetical protein